MAFTPRTDAALRYACAVLEDCQADRLPVDPIAVAASAGISVLPFSQVTQNAAWDPWNLNAALGMSHATTISYPGFCVIYRDEVQDAGRLRWAVAHELGHLFLNHFRDYPDQMSPGFSADSGLEAEADIFARNLLAPVPLVDVIRYNRPRQARAPLFGLSRSAWMRRLETLAEDRSFLSAEMADAVLYPFRSYLLKRRCARCGRVFEDRRDAGRCPGCKGEELEWLLE